MGRFKEHFPEQFGPESMEAANTDEMVQQNRASLKDALSLVDKRKDRKVIKSAVKEASKIAKELWGRGFSEKDIFIREFGGDQLGEATPGRREDGREVHPSILSPVARAKFIEVLVHESSHALGGVDGEKGEVFAHAITIEALQQKGYSAALQGENYESMVEALAEMADIVNERNRLEGLTQMAKLYVDDSNELYNFFIRQYCKSKGANAFALWLYKDNPFDTERSFGKEVPRLAEEAHELFVKAFPELNNAIREGGDGQIDIENASFQAA